MAALYGESSSNSVFLGPKRLNEGTAQSLRRSFRRMGFERGFAGSMAPTCVHLSCPHTNASLSLCSPQMCDTSVFALCCCALDHTPTVKCSNAQATNSFMCGRL